MRKMIFVLSSILLGLATTQSASASNGTAKELVQYCNPQSETDAKTYADTVLNKHTMPDPDLTAGAGNWLACMSYMDGFIRGYSMAFQVGMGFTEYHLKQQHNIDVSDAEMRGIAAKELGLWYLCLPDPHSSDMEAHVVSEYLYAHPEALSQLSEDAVKAAFDASFKNLDGSCKHQP